MAGQFEIAIKDYSVSGPIPIIKLVGEITGLEHHEAKELIKFRDTLAESVSAKHIANCQPH